VLQRRKRILKYAEMTTLNQRKKAVGKLPYRLLRPPNPLVVTGRSGRVRHQRAVAVSSPRNYRFDLKLPEEWQLEG
jgi:hypothetical protein